jgi:hypothetical protein
MKCHFQLFQGKIISILQYLEQLILIIEQLDPEQGLLYLILLTCTCIWFDCLIFCLEATIQNLLFNHLF